MSNERLTVLENALSELRGLREARDEQIGFLATENASLKAEFNALKSRVEVVATASNPPTFLSIWGPAAASLGLVATIGGSFLTMTQREQDAKLQIVQSHVEDSARQIDLARTDLKFLDSQIRITERDFRGRVSATEARQELFQDQLKFMGQQSLSRQK